MTVAFPIRPASHFSQAPARGSFFIFRYRIVQDLSGTVPHPIPEPENHPQKTTKNISKHRGKHLKNPCFFLPFLV